MFTFTEQQSIDRLSITAGVKK